MAVFIGATNGVSGTVTGRDGEGDATRLIVSSDGLTLRCRNDPAIEIGTPVVAYIRPEDVRVLTDGGDSFDNVIEGSIDRVIFEGPTAQVRVDIGGREFRVDVSGGERLVLAASKGRIRLGFDDITLVPIDAAAGSAASTSTS